MPAIIPVTVDSDDELLDASRRRLYGLTAEMTWTAKILQNASALLEWTHLAELNPDSTDPMGWDWDGSNLTIPDPTSNEDAGDFVGGVWVPWEQSFYQTPNGYLGVPEGAFISDGFSNFKRFALGGWYSPRAVGFTLTIDPTFHAEANGYDITFTPTLGGNIHPNGAYGPVSGAEDIAYTLEWKLNDGDWVEGDAATPYVQRIAKGLNHIMRLRLTDAYGRIYVFWRRFDIGNYPPVALFGWERDEENGLLVYFDGTLSSDRDGYITDWAWLYTADEAGEVAADVESISGTDSQPVVTFAESALPHVWAWLTVTDNDGATDTFGPQQILLKESPARFGSFVDAENHVLFSAVNDGDNVQVSRFPNGAASRELLAVIPDAKNPSLWRSGARTITLAYTDRSDGACKLLTSTDDGRTFT
jgi:hypothetical protein